MILSMGDYSNSQRLRSDDGETLKNLNFLIKKGYIDSLSEIEKSYYSDYDSILYSVDFSSKGQKVYNLARKVLDNLMMVEKIKEKERLLKETSLKPKRPMLKPFRDSPSKTFRQVRILNCVELMERMHRNPSFIPRWAWKCDEYEDEDPIKKFKKNH
mgnify:CR=1 FL=1